MHRMMVCLYLDLSWFVVSLAPFLLVNSSRTLWQRSLWQLITMIGGLNYRELKNVCFTANFSLITIACM